MPNHGLQRTTGVAAETWRYALASLRKRGKVETNNIESDNPYHITPNTPGQRLSEETRMMLFQTHISICINSANLVWQRFNIMLAANAIVFGFLASRTQPATSDMVFGAFFGMALCMLWYFLIVSEWEFFRQWMRLSRRFTFHGFPPEANPHIAIDRHRVPYSRAAFYAAHWTIVAFAFVYAFLLIRFCLQHGC